MGDEIFLRQVYLFRMLCYIQKNICVVFHQKIKSDV